MKIYFTNGLVKEITVQDGAFVAKIEQALLDYCFKKEVRATYPTVNAPILFPVKDNEGVDHYIFLDKVCMITYDDDKNEKGGEV